METEEEPNNSLKNTGMEEGANNTSSYRYWVRDMTTEAAPLPVPKKLSAQDIVKQSQSQSQSGPLGSVWNQAGTWEERNLSTWASNRIKELLNCLDALEFSSGKAKIQEVSSCVGDASLVTVRNKKRVGYSYEISLKFRGEWLIQECMKEIKGNLKIPDASFGELEDMQLEVTLKEDKEIPDSERSKILKDLKAFLSPIRDKFLKFEEELKSR